jgi:pimeloyl-ACP methyl ester carboxylesterase
MTRYFGLCCHGLGVIQPVDWLAAFLNKNTPAKVHFEIVGGIDPRPLEGSIISTADLAMKRGNRLIFIGHSLGAMLAFYLADRLKAEGKRAPLFVSLDPTGWGTNAPGIAPWSQLTGGEAGKWYVPDSVDTWMAYRTTGYVGDLGGGYAQLAPGNVTTEFAEYTRTEDHIGFVSVPEVQQQILDVVKQVVAQ